MSAATTCPYCNATVPLTLPLPADRRVPCPRCGERVPVKGEDALAVAAVIDRLPAAPEPPAPRPRRTNPPLALGLLALMVFMASIALAYPLKPVAFRRANDVKNREPEFAPPATDVPPADLPGVGYLPDDVQLIAGVRVAAARQN